MTTHVEKPTALVVDDEVGNLKVFRRAFRRHLDVTLAHGPLEAIEEAGRRSFDIVLADYSMPDMDGLQLLERLRDVHPAMRRFLVTGHIDLEAIRRARATQVCEGVIAKPWSVEDVLSLLSQEPPEA